MQNGHAIQFVLVQLQIDQIWQIVNALFTHLGIVIVPRKITVALKKATTTTAAAAIILITDTHQPHIKWKTRRKKEKKIMIVA